jgi:hypothetical protein
MKQVGELGDLGLEHISAKEYDRIQRCVGKKRVITPKRADEDIWARIVQPWIVYDFEDLIEGLVEKKFESLRVLPSYDFGKRNDFFYDNKGWIIESIQDGIKHERAKFLAECMRENSRPDYFMEAQVHTLWYGGQVRTSSFGFLKKDGSILCNEVHLFALERDRVKINCPKFYDQSLETEWLEHPFLSALYDPTA